MSNSSRYFNDLTLNSQKEICIAYVTKLKKAIPHMSSNYITLFYAFAGLLFGMSDASSFELNRSCSLLTCHKQYESFFLFLE